MSCLSRYLRCFRLIPVMLLLLCTACATRPGGYTNSDGSTIDKSIFEVAEWMVRSRLSQADSTPQGPFKDYRIPLVRSPEGTAPALPDEFSVTWLGHASVLLRMDGQVILTDPHFSERASPVSWAGPRRRVPPPYQLENLPHVDVVVLSHNHYDHLDLPSLKALYAQAGGPPQLLAPAGLAPWLVEQGFSGARSLGWWESIELGPLHITGLPAHHGSGRGLFDKNATHWGGWLIRSPHFSTYFAGDTGYSADFTEIGRRTGGMDLALIPVGAYQPRDFMADQHVDPTQAVQIFQDVRARLALGIHWSTFEMASEPLDAPIADLAHALQAASIPPAQFRLVPIGSTLRLGTHGQWAPPPWHPYF